MLGLMYGDSIDVRRSGALDSSLRLADELRAVGSSFRPDGRVTLEVPLFDDLSAKLEAQLVDGVSLETVSLVGVAVLSDGRKGWFSVGVSADQVAMSIVLDGTGEGSSNSIFRVETVGAERSLLVAEVDPSTFPQTREAEVPSPKEADNRNRSALETALQPVNQLSTGGPGSPKIDLLIAYDSSAIQEIAGYSGYLLNGSWGAGRHKFMALSMPEVGLMNFGMQNSQVPARIKILGYYQSDTNYPGTTVVAAPGDLQDTTDGILDDVPVERDRLGADLVMFITNTDGAGAGLGFTLDNNGLADSSFAYAAADSSCFWGCTYIFAHELGHVFGNGHSANANDGPGFSDYSRARADFPAKRVTINASNEGCPDCVRVLYYSNPAVSFAGWTTGAADEDNARTMRDQMYALANYRVAQTAVVGIASFTTNTLKFWTATGFADLIAHGGAPFHGDASDVALSGSVVDIEDNDPWGGYWMVTDDGQILNFGAADFGDPSNLNLSQPVVAMSNSTNSGYWLVAKDGGIFAYGSAGYYGSLPALGISVTNIVDIVARPQGNGYWLLGSDGGVFSFGAAGFYGSLPGLGLSISDAVSIEVNKTGNGYWIVRSNGSVYSFGAAPFRGSLSTSNVVEIDRYGSSNNYRIVRNDGSVARCTGSCSWL